MKNKALILTAVGLSAAVMAGIGIATSLILTAVDAVPKSNLALGSVYTALVGLLFFVLIVEIISVIKIDDSTIHTVILAVCLILLYAFSTDMQLFLADFGIAVPDIVCAVVSEAAFILIAVCCGWYIVFLYRLSVNTKVIAAISVPALTVLMTVYSLTNFYGCGYIAHFIITALAIITICAILYRAAKKSKLGITTYFVSALFCLSVGAQNANALAFDRRSTAVPGISLFYAAMTFASFMCVYLLFSINTDSKAVKSSEYKHQAELFATKALSGQIKPHFIFNSLEAVRTLYHQDVASGDAAVSLLSDFLRGSINAFDNELIPFETEIDNIFNYTEFENLKHRNRIEVIYNIDFTEFSVPPFSIQPFVENAIKYSGVDETENGNIIISSYKSGESAVVEIIDNGKGFDLSNVPKNSHGIKNASGRFALTLDTVPEITSIVGEGTHVKIVIDLNKRKEGKK